RRDPTRARTESSPHRRPGRRAVSYRLSQANVFKRNHVNGILDARPDVFRCELGVIVPTDLGGSQTLAHQFQYALDGDARAGDARLAEVNIRLHNNPTPHRLPPGPVVLIDLPTVVDP